MTLSPPAALVTLAYAGVHSYFFFYFPLIDMGLFKDRVVAMGKPHCNYSICNFRSCSTLGIYPPVPELAEGGPAYAEFQSWHLISMDSPLSRGMTEPGRFVPRALVTFTSRHRHLRVCGGPVFLLPAHFDSVFFRVIPWLI